MVKRTYFFRLKLKDALRARGVSQKELAEMTGLREATISEMANNSRSVINKNHLAKVMDALNIIHLEDIIDFRYEEEF